MEKYGTSGQATDDNIIQCMRFVWWITKSTNTHSEHVIRIAFPLQQWLHERASMLRYTYIACLVREWLRDDLVSGTDYWHHMSEDCWIINAKGKPS